MDERLVEYRALRNYDHKKRGDKYWERVETFNRMCKSIIDIRADHIRTKSQEKVWRVKMTIMDHQFYDQQCLDGQPGYGGTFVDKTWQLTMMRKKHADNVLQKSREKLQVPRK